MVPAFVNGYSDNHRGQDPNPIVSLFIPDGSRDFHGSTGTTIWMTRAQFEKFKEETPDA